MAKYLKPRRGSTSSAVAQKMILKKGEIFFEFPNGHTGKEPAKLMIGDGISGYDMQSVNPDDTSGASIDSWQPGLIHPVLYSPEFTDSNPSTSSWTFNSGTYAINKIKPYSKDSHMGNLPKIIGNIKEALVNHADSLNKLNEDIDKINHVEFLNDNATTYDLNFDFNNISKSYIFGDKAIVDGHPLSQNGELVTGKQFTLQVIQNGSTVQYPVSSEYRENIYTTQVAYVHIGSAKYDIYTRYLIASQERGDSQVQYLWSDWLEYRNVNELYPVGSIYMAGNASINPNDFLPGSWSRIGNSANDYVLKTITSGNSTTVAAGKTGETTAPVPYHTHKYQRAYVDSYETFRSGGDTGIEVTAVGDVKTTTETIEAGSTATHTHTAGMPKSIGVHVWIRTA